jgi:hypothetical protein
MTCLRYPATDPYYPGHVIHLRGDEDPHEFVRAMPRAVEFIECDCRAAQRVSGVSGGAAIRTPVRYNLGVDNESAPEALERSEGLATSAQPSDTTGGSAA